MTLVEHHLIEDCIDETLGDGDGILAMLRRVARRFGDAIASDRQAQAERQIRDDLARSGGRLTDEIERRMMRQLAASNFNALG